MISVDGVHLPRVDGVLGIDLSLTATGVAAITEGWGGVPPKALATTLDGVPTSTVRRGLVLKSAADRIASRAIHMLPRSQFILAVIEAPLYQSMTGKAPERAALWHMVTAALAEHNIAVAQVNPTTRRALAHDDEARAALKAARDALKSSTGLTAKEITREKGRISRLGKLVGLQSARRRWPEVVLPDDNASDALVCADLGARALGWAGLPPLGYKNLPSAIKSLGIEERKAQ